jgi:trk system potassium uptake protein TrkA
VPRKKKPEFAVIGLGRFGRAVAMTLAERGLTVVGIDRDQRIVQNLSEDITQTITLDAIDEDALREADIQLYDTVVVTLERDFKSKLLTTLTLKALGVKRVICTAASERERAILLKIGADQVVLPEYDSGRRLALALAMPTHLGDLPLGEHSSLRLILTPTAFIGQSPQAIDLQKKYNLILLALKRGDELIVAPFTDCRLEPGDQLILAGQSSDFSRLEEAA